MKKEPNESTKLLGKSKSHLNKATDDEREKIFLDVEDDETSKKENFASKFKMAFKSLNTGNSIILGKSLF